jgi:hypothetical protein
LPRVAQVIHPPRQLLVRFHPGPELMGHEVLFANQLGEAALELAHTRQGRGAFHDPRRSRSHLSGGRLRNYLPRRSSTPSRLVAVRLLSPPLASRIAVPLAVRRQVEVIGAIEHPATNLATKWLHRWAASLAEFRLTGRHQQGKSAHPRAARSRFAWCWDGVEHDDRVAILRLRNSTVHHAIVGRTAMDQAASGELNDSPAAFVADAVALLAKHGATDEGFRAVGARLRRLARQPGIVADEHLVALHGSAAAATVLHEGADGTCALLLGRFPAEAPTPVHNHNTWGIACVVQGRDRYLRWERRDDGTDPTRAALSWPLPPRAVHGVTPCSRALRS